MIKKKFAQKLFSKVSEKSKLKLTAALRIQQTPYNCLFLLTSYVVLDYHFE